MLAMQYVFQKKIKSSFISRFAQNALKERIFPIKNGLRDKTVHYLAYFSEKSYVFDFKCKIMPKIAQMPNTNTFGPFRSMCVVFFAFQEMRETKKWKEKFSATYKFFV